MSLIDVLTGGDDWVRRAACRDVDPALFFPEGTSDMNDARAICAGCPVRKDCLDHALERNECYGMWGGTSPTDRRAIRRGEIPHGKNGYANYGCRCDICRAAQADYDRARRTPKPWPARRHGTRTMYVEARCRCDECRAAQSEYDRQRHLRLVAER